MKRMTRWVIPWVGAIGFAYRFLFPFDDFRLDLFVMSVCAAASAFGLCYLLPIKERSAGEDFGGAVNLLWILYFCFQLFMIFSFPVPD
jgi:hypothetical protein